MNPEIRAYHEGLPSPYQKMADDLFEVINDNLPNAENKIWHAHPVWFLDGNPIVGYSLQKKGLRLMFWSGADFGETSLSILGGKFKDASIFYHHPGEIQVSEVQGWLQKSILIQWDYKNLVKRKGRLQLLLNNLN
ncbi:MAG: DUF1801 domain-containing protein [Saprospiraceae bacterium]